MTSAGSQSRASWPGIAVERALALVAADYRRPIGPIVIAVVIAAAAVAGAGKTGPFGPVLAASLGVLGTAPIAVIRRFPGPAIAAVLAANAAFIVAGRLSWSVAGVAGWLVALAACPVVLARPGRAGHGPHRVRGPARRGRPGPEPDALGRNGRRGAGRRRRPGRGRDGTRQEAVGDRAGGQRRAGQIPAGPARDQAGAECA